MDRRDVCQEMALSRKLTKKNMCLMKLFSILSSGKDTRKLKT